MACVPKSASYSLTTSAQEMTLLCTKLKLSDICDKLSQIQLPSSVQNNNDLCNAIDNVFLNYNKGFSVPNIDTLLYSFNKIELRSNRKTLALLQHRMQNLHVMNSTDKVTGIQDICCMVLQTRISEKRSRSNGNKENSLALDNYSRRYMNYSPSLNKLLSDLIDSYDDDNQCSDQTGHGWLDTTESGSLFSLDLD